MKELRRKVVLPVFQLSELTTDDDPRAIKRVIKQGKGHQALTYHYRYVQDEPTGHSFSYNLFPIVLDREGVPWYLCTFYILSKLEGAGTVPNMSSVKSVAEDLGAYKEWLDTLPKDITFEFPQIKLRRPTYRYRGYLQRQIQAGEITPKTAKRRMASVINFYSSLIKNNHFQPEYPPWEERKYQISFQTTEGRSMTKKVISTDVSIRTSKSVDPFAGTIQDGGRLRPLTGEEQDWILEATMAKGNTECYMLQLFMLATGARIQTACTLRLRHFEKPDPRYSRALTGEGEVFKLIAGPGTGIDTKNGKRGVLQVPRPVYEMLHTYAQSNRAKLRRERFLVKQGEHPDPYLFLTQQGTPYYTGKSETMRFNPKLDRRYEKAGQSIRQFITDQVITYVREHHDKRFHYRIHDLRASFGMNTTELLMKLVAEKKITLHRARMTVRDLMWHQSFATTDLYLDYRSQMNEMYKAVNGYGEHLQKWKGQAMQGIEITDE